MGCRDNHCEPLPIFETEKKCRQYYLDLHKLIRECTLGLFLLRSFKFQCGMHYFYEQIKDGMVCLRLWRSSVVTWHFERPLTNVHARKSDVLRCPRHKFEDDLDTYDFTTQIVYSCKGFKFIFMILFPFFMILCFNIKLYKHDAV